MLRVWDWMKESDLIFALGPKPAQQRSGRWITRDILPGSGLKGFGALGLWTL